MTKSAPRPARCTNRLAPSSQSGAALVARNIPRHLEEKPADAPKDSAPLACCWRGGRRSGAMARNPGEIGWKVTLVDGGYKTCRSSHTGRRGWSRSPAGPQGQANGTNNKGAIWPLCHRILQDHPLKGCAEREGMPASVQQLPRPGLTLAQPIRSWRSNEGV